MAGVIHTAAQRLNSSVAGLTGAVALPQHEPGAQHPTSPTELLDQLPTEFGGLTHLFGGGGLVESPTQHAPVNVGRVIPAGSVKGALGGLVPDVRNTTNNAVASGRRAAVPLAESARQTWAKARAALKI